VQLILGFATVATPVSRKVPNCMTRLACYQDWKAIHRHAWDYLDCEQHSTNEKVVLRRRVLLLDFSDNQVKELRKFIPRSARPAFILNQIEGCHTT
jgi:hypothetical protein